ncbi:MAG: restriction endonuclease subunit S [Candidatus Cryptobacteroides sp.]
MANNNKHTGPNVPALRFPEFSGEWERKSLSEFVDRVTRKNRSLQSTRPLTISAQYGLVDQTQFFKKSVAGADLSNYYLLNNGEFAYNKSYSDGYPLGAIKRLDRYDSGVLSSLYICFAPKPFISSDYLVQYFESTKWNQAVKDISGEGARNHGLLNVPVTSFFETQHFIPKKDEQNKIGSFLTLIEKRIAVQSKIIEEQETLLKSLADKLFLHNNHSCQLSELVNIEKGKQLNADTLSETGDYYVMNGGITPSGYYSEYNVPAGVISISEGGNSCGYVQFNEKPFWSGGHCYSLQCRTNLVDYKYIYYYLKTKEADVMNLRIGSGLPNIQKKDIEKFTISYPSLQLQKQFVKALDALSGKINTEKNLLEKYCQQKSYFLSQMFI